MSSNQNNSDYELNLNDGVTEQERASFSEIASNLIYKVPRKLRIVLCIILVSIIIIGLLNAFKPEARKRAIPETVVRVEVITAEPSSYPIVVNANGTVEAETRGDLVAQIRGEIVAVSDNFNTGGSFNKGDVLIQLDQRDYQADLSQALASLSQADAAYRQEQATAKQAEQDWKRLGNTEPAPDLVLRKPQLTAAKAQFDSAKAAADSARLNLDRTTIKAPYNGRIIERKAVLGQYVSVGTPIAEVFATDGVEVRLPISQEEFSQLGLDSFSNESDVDNPFSVSITSTVGNQGFQWDAKITRTDSTFDINTRQIDIVAKVADPFGKISGQRALKIGQFVSARIQGRTVDDVFVIPNKSIREGSYVYTVRDGKLAKQSINILWQDDQNALLSQGLSNGELIVTTSLNSTLAGASAKFDEPVLAKSAADTAEVLADAEGSLNAEGSIDNEAAEGFLEAEGSESELEQVQTENAESTSPVSSDNADALEEDASTLPIDSQQAELGSAIEAVEKAAEDITADGEQAVEAVSAENGLSQ